MPIYKFACNKCFKRFDKFLVTTDISVTCSVCESPDVKRIFNEDASLPSRTNTIPAGVLSGGNCKSGFS
jgi:putative FmdB family regulatory protein